MIPIQYREYIQNLLKRDPKKFRATDIIEAYDVVKNSQPTVSRLGTIFGDVSPYMSTEHILQVLYTYPHFLANLAPTRSVDISYNDLMKILYRLGDVNKNWEILKVLKNLGRIYTYTNYGKEPYNFIIELVVEWSKNLVAYGRYGKRYILDTLYKNTLKSELSAYAYRLLHKAYSELKHLYGDTSISVDKFSCIYSNLALPNPKCDSCIHRIDKLASKFCWDESMARIGQNFYIPISLITNSNT